MIGVTGSTDTIEALATMGMGLLAGSTIMLLTLIWGSVIAFGSYDLSQPSDSSDVENKRQFSLTGFSLLSSLTNIKHLCNVIDVLLYVCMMQVMVLALTLKPTILQE